MRHPPRILVLAAMLLAACSEGSSRPKVGNGGSHYLPDGGQLFSDGGVELPDGGGLLPDGGIPGLCATHHDCGAGQVCIAGACAAGGQVGNGGRCSATLDCNSGLYCGPNGFCVHVGSGAADAGCMTDGDCASGLRCVYQGFSSTCQAATGDGDLGDSCTAQTDCLAGLFCSNGVGGPRTCEPYAQAFPAYTGPTCNDDAPLRVYFQVPRPSGYPSDFFRLPYPNDARVTVDDGGMRHLDISDFPTPGVSLDDVDLVQLYKDSLTADFDGFSTVAPVTFRFSGPIDFTTLSTPTQSFVKIVDLTAPSASGVFFYEYSYVINGNKYNCPNRLTVGPTEATPFKGGHTYAALLLSGIKDSSGNGVLGDADLASILGSSPPSDPGLANAYAAYAPLRAWIADPNNAISSNQIIGASVFTVAQPLAAMTGVASAVAALPAPTLSDLEVCGSGGLPSTCDALGPDHACSASSADFYEIHGRMSLPIFQQGQEPYLTPDAGGGIAFDASGNAVKQRDENVCFALTVPKSAPPASGWPLVITHHGTDGSMTDFIRSGVSDRLATAPTPMAVLGFDAVEHADRRGGSTKDPEDLVFNALNPRAARDNFLQGAADILSEAKVASLTVNADADGGPGAITFDTTHVEFFGHSQGSTSGELALPFLDAAPNAVLSGASAHLTQSLLHKTSPINIKQGLAALLQEDPGQLDTEHPVLGLYQNFFDRADPINAVGAIVNAPLTGHAPHSVFLTWGTNDTYTPQQVLNANVVAMNVPIVDAGAPLEGSGFASVDRPVQGNVTVGTSTVTAAFAQYQTPDGGDGHFVAFEVPGAETDWTNFLESGLSGTPQLP